MELPTKNPERLTVRFLVGSRKRKVNERSDALHRTREPLSSRMFSDNGNRQAVKCVGRPGTPLTRMAYRCASWSVRFAIFRAPGRQDSRT